jgi:hypothetical protein
MDGLLQLQKYLILSGLSYERHDDAIVLLAQPKVGAPISIWESDDGYTYANVDFLLNPENSLRSEELIQSMLPLLSEDDAAGFENTTSTFAITYRFLATEAEESVERFVDLVTSCLVPLFEHMQRAGEWDDMFVWFALYRPEISGLIGHA